MVESIYLVSDGITPVPARDVDRLERAAGSLPLGYREFMKHCGGEGDLCDFMWIWPPRDILERGESERREIADQLITLKFKIRPLTRADLDSLWVVGRGEMPTLLYAPRHEGVLFNVAHRGAAKEGSLVRHARAFTDPAALYWWGQVRHPFPYFSPGTRKERGFASFGLRSNAPIDDIAEKIGRYWDAEGGPVHRVRMPSCTHGDCVYVFVKQIGGYISVARSRETRLAGARGEVVFKKVFRKEANRFVKQLALR